MVVQSDFDRHFSNFIASDVWRILRVLTLFRDSDLATFRFKIWDTDRAVSLPLALAR